MDRIIILQILGFHIRFGDPRAAHRLCLENRVSLSKDASLAHSILALIVLSIRNMRRCPEGENLPRTPTPLRAWGGRRSLLARFPYLD